MKSEAKVPVTCSSAAPWGIHATIRDNVCIRCGWIAREEPAQVVPLVVPEKLRPAA